MHILVTNDDGIGAVGLKALADAALRRGHRVTVAAPAGHRSAVSQHITLSSPLMVRPVPWEGAEACAVDGMPTDCVRLGPYMTDTPIDFCLSGINDGENAGSAVYYSGTVSAAREAAMCHIPSMAVSIMLGADDAMRAALADLAVSLAERFADVKLPRFAFVNLNAPALPPGELKSLKVCPLSRAYYRDGYEKRVSPRGQTYFWLNTGDDTKDVMEEVEPGSDLFCLREGHVTCTILGGFSDHNREFAALTENLMRPDIT